MCGYAIVLSVGYTIIESIQVIEPVQLNDYSDLFMCAIIYRWIKRASAPMQVAKLNTKLVKLLTNYDGVIVSY